jgi:hypothetical protein
MSAFGGKADIAIDGQNVRLWPKADLGPVANSAVVIQHNNTVGCGMRPWRLWETTWQL